LNIYPEFIKGQTFYLISINAKIIIVLKSNNYELRLWGALEKFALEIANSSFFN